MKTITVPGDPHPIRAIMVNKTELFRDHETLRIDSSNGNHSVEKTIFRMVDAGEDKWELQFE
jgi:hypothetical protein